MGRQIRTLLFGPIMAAALMAAWPAAAQQYTFKIVNLPAYNTIPLRYIVGIIDANTVLALAEPTLPTSTCWLINPATGKATVFAVPHASLTRCGGGNAGQVFGTYSTGINSSFGFVYKNGAFATFTTPPGNPAGTPYAISDSGIIVGNFNDGSSVSFVENGANFTTFTVPGLPYAGPTAVNDNEEIVIFGYDGVGGEQSYLKRGDLLTKIAYPRSRTTQANAINNLGQVAGTYSDRFGNIHGFVYDSKKGVYHSIDAPNANWTTLSGIDDQGTLIGASFPAGASTYVLFEATRKP